MDLHHPPERYELRTEREPFVGVGAVAAHLGKPASFIYNRAVELGLPMYRVGNQLRFKLSEVDQWVKDRAA